MKKYLIVVMGMVFFSSPVFAAGYGEAGCGLGSLIFGDSPGPVQIFAATTNASSYSQLFGITSGTSNCDASGIILAEKEGDLFVASNFDHLEKEMAIGEGEHVSTLAGILGCPSDRGAQFASYAQNNYQVIFASDQTTPEEALQAVRTGMAQDPELSASCIH